jgi:hypothetical protein
MAKGLRDRLIGAWELQEYTATAEDGTVAFPMGADATGLIIYTPDGYMSAQLMVQGRPAYASGDMEGGTAEEQRAATRGYIAYSGPFSVDEANRTLKHHVSVCLLPNWIGDTQVRFVQLKGNILTLSAAPMRYGGTPRIPRLIWKRAERHRV